MIPTILKFTTVGLVFLVVVALNILNTKTNHKKAIKILTSIVSITALITTVFVVIPDKKISDAERNEIVKETETALSSKLPDKLYNPNFANKDGKETFDKQSAINALEKMLNQVHDRNNPKTAENRFNEITQDNSKFKDIVSQDVLSRIHATDIFAKENYYINTVLTLLSVTNEISRIEQDNQIKVQVKDLNHVYLDEATKSAYIPLDIFTGKAHATTFQMVYVDNQWKLLPHSLLQAVELHSLLTEGR